MYLIKLDENMAMSLMWSKKSIFKENMIVRQYDSKM